MATPSLSESRALARRGAWRRLARRGARRPLALAGATAMLAALTTLTQSTLTQAPESPRVRDRIQGLQREAERLAGEARTLVGELRRLEVERDLRRADAAVAQSEAAAARTALEAASARLAALENERMAQMPDLRAQLVDIYKHGRAGYAEMVLGARSVREFARATRAVAALAALNRNRVADHRRTLESLGRERAAIEEKSAELAAREAAALAASRAAERAVAARTALVAEIDSRRDLTAQYTSELQAVADRLQQQVVPAAAGEVNVPLAPFRGTLDWPVAGRIIGRFGDANRLGGAVVRNGVDIAVAEGAAVQAVHGGTVSFADVFTGFGTLVIVDHGNNSYSLYGYLASAVVMRGDRVVAGAELGRAGSAPGGPPAVYFELRIDGRAVDPIQWLARERTPGVLSVPR